jgi:sugar phosphate isomerase/epimerase
MLEKNRVKAGIYTCYNPGLSKSEPWMKAVKEFGGSMIVAGAGGPKGITGDELKRAIQKFAEAAKPAIHRAGELGVQVALENHAGGLLSEMDALPWMMEAIPDQHVGIALAPYHLPQDAQALARLIKTLGQRILHFYAWQHGEGSSKRMPKVLEMKQMAGYGPLDFRPLIAAFQSFAYDGFTSVFMHPVPRGSPILPTAPEITAAINRSRQYLENCAVSV